MSTFGKIFRATTFGESHSNCVGVVIDGVPPRMRLGVSDIQPQLNRRRPGQSSVTSPRNEEDKVVIHCGLENGFTLGTPIMMQVINKEYVRKDYEKFSNVPRPSHADFTYRSKYGITASSGGGRSSARETIGRICAGTVAEKWLTEYYNTRIVAWVSSVGEISAGRDFENSPLTLTRQTIDRNPVRCPDQKQAEKMAFVIRKAKEDKDSVGGTITCTCENVPVGLGEPVFDKLKANLAHAMLSIPAAVGFEYGSGFEGTLKRGSENNDAFIKDEKRKHKIRCTTNNSGGIQGGISNGEKIVFRAAFKPVSTIGVVQKTVDYDGEKVDLEGAGRHDPCVLPRAVPIVESMAALVLIDAALMQLQREKSSEIYEFVGRP